MAQATHTEIFNCKPEQFFKIITDYEKYPEFLNEVKKMRILETSPNKKKVQYQVSVLKTFTYDMWMYETPFSEVRWEFAGGDLFKSSTGFWKLETQGENHTKATYSVDVQFNLLVPAPISKALVTVNLPTMMKNYHQRIKKLYP